MVDICYVASHGFAVRMVLQTNLLGKLQNAGLKVALIVPDIHDENISSYCSINNIELHEWNPTSSYWSNQYFQSRKYFFEDIRNNPALLEKHYYELEKESQNWLKRIKLHLLMLINKISVNFKIFKNYLFKREQKNLSSSDADELIKHIGPKILVSTYPVNFSEAMLIKSANDNENVSTIIHLLSWDNITCKGYFPQLADQFLAWGPIMKEELMEYYKIDESNIHICGVPHFDVHRQKVPAEIEREIEETIEIDFSQPVIFFGMSSPRFAPREIDIVEFIAKEISEGKYGDLVQLIVRPHPQNVKGNLADKSWLPRLQFLNNLKKVYVDFPRFNKKTTMDLSMQQTDMYRLSYILRNSKMCLQSGSTLGIDSLICEVPVVMTSFDGNEDIPYWKSARRLLDFPHLKKFVKLNNIYIADDYNALNKLVNQLLSDDIFNENNVHLEVSEIKESTREVAKILNKIA